MNKTKVLTRVLSYVFKYKFMVVMAFILTILSNFLSLCGPKLSGMALDAIGLEKGKVNFPLVYKYCMLMFIVYAISSLLGYMLNRLMISLSQKITYQMRKEVFEHLVTLPVSYFDHTATGDIVSRLSYDIDTINTSLSTDLLQIATSLITILGSLIMMITISPLLTCVFIFTVPVSILFTAYKTKHIKPLFSLRSRKLGELNGFCEEMLSGQKTIKAYGVEEKIIDKFDDQNNSAVEAYYNADYQGSIIGPSVTYINNLTLSLISMFGALLYLADGITLGNISSFVLYSRKFAGPINESANIMSEIQSALSAAARVFKVLDEPSEKADGENAIELKKCKGDVDFDHVKFGYTPEKEIIHDLDVHITSGQTIAIVGPTGAGKTTIINLLMRFYDVNEGSIRLDGIDIRSIKRGSLRNQFTMVLQDTWLFNGSVYDNIAFGNINATREKVIQAAKASHIHDFIESLDMGYDTILSDDGVNISKGQKQLLTISRAMLSDASILILDEATSNVDSRTEILIQDAMSKLCKGKTSFIIAHRLSTIQNADCILVIKDGRLCETGTHESLLESKGFYASLYNSQYEE